jgi:hypothetical protein
LIIGSHLSLAFKFFSADVPSYNKSIQILKQQSIQKRKTKVWIFPTIAIATTTQ